MGNTIASLIPFRTKANQQKLNWRNPKIWSIDFQNAKPPDPPAPIIVHPTIENEKHQEPFKKNVQVGFIWNNQLFG